MSNSEEAWAYVQFRGGMGLCPIQRRHRLMSNSKEASEYVQLRGGVRINYIPFHHDSTVH